MRALPPMALLVVVLGCSGGEKDGGTPEPQSPYDPADGVVTPGEHGGAGCPDTDATSFTFDAGTSTARVFSGTVTGASGAGVFYVRGSGNQELFGAIPTAAGGAYQVNVPLFCGPQLVKLTWQGASCTYAAVYAVSTAACDVPDIRVTLSWDAIGRDWELHLVKPGGRINDDATDCTWTSCIGTSPDWGVVGDPSDDPVKDVDDTGPYGPENITLRKPEPGTYTVLVEHWSAGGDPLSAGRVVLNVAGKPVVVVAKAGLAPRHVWTAATITFPGGMVAPAQTDHDCSANWSNGCLDPIP